MPEAALEILVSMREIDRPRLLQAVACDADGATIEGLPLRLQVDENGTFNDDAAEQTRDMVTPADGAVIFHWYEYPRGGPARNLTSVVRATWERPDAFVYIENLYE